MGWEARNNPTAIAAKQGLISPKKKPMSKREQDALIYAKAAEIIDKRTGLFSIMDAIHRQY